MTTFGVTPTGFVRPRLDEVRAYVVQIWTGKFGDNAQTGSDQVDGMVIDWLARSLSWVWEHVEGAYAAHHLGSAQDRTLESVLGLFAFVKLAESASTAEAVLYGTGATVVPGDPAATLGSAMSVGDTGARFTLDADATIGATDTVFVGRVNGVAVGETYTLTVNGTDFSYVALAGDTVSDIRDGLASAINGGAEPVTAKSGGLDPSDRAVVVVDSSSGASFTFASSATTAANIDDFEGVRAAVTAELVGPTTAVAGTLNTRESTVSGWEGVTNTTDATVGRDTETDAEYRSRFRTLMQRQGGSTDAIADRLEAIGNTDGDTRTAVTQAKVFENDTDVVDASGRDPHSIEAVVLGGDAQDIVDEIWAAKAGGIATNGTSSGTATDREGGTHTVNYTRPQEVYVHMNLVVTPGEGYPTTGTPLQAIADAVLAFASANHPIGRDVYAFAIGAAGASAVAGVASIAVTMGITAGPNDPTPPLLAADISINDDAQVADFDSSRIAVV